MMKHLLCIFIYFLLINNSAGQNEATSDFFEIGIQLGGFIESSFLETTKYKKELSDPLLENIGLIESNTGPIYSIKLRYGMGIFLNAHAIMEIGLSQFNEQVMCFCHSCGKVAKPETLVSLSAINGGLGLRYEIFAIKKFNFSVESMIIYSILTNESGFGHLGYSIHPFIGFQVHDQIGINLKFGYEESFQDYQKKTKYLEFAINYQLDHSRNK